MDILRGALGVAVILGLCAAFSTDRRAISGRLIMAGLALQILLGLLVFRTSVGESSVQAITEAFTRVLDFSYTGSSFVFGTIGSKDAPGGPYLAFQMLPIIIYFAAIMAILYHLGIMQVVIYLFARLLGHLLRVSGAESMAVTANIFVGMTEAPLVVRPYLERMTQSELMALMCGGFATVAGTVLGVYISFVGEEYGAYLIAASVMSAPAAFVISKTLVPETASPATGADLRLEFHRSAHNLLDAIAVGVKDGLFLALNIGAMLIAFYALIALINWPLEAWFGASLQQVFGVLLMPLAWCLGVEWGAQAESFGTLLGMKLCINEWIAYDELRGMIQEESLSPRSIKIATFALCGFANLGSVGITLGGLGQLVPSRRRDLSRLVLRAMIGGALASFLTAAVAGIFV